METGSQTFIDNSLFPNPYQISRPEWRENGRAFTFEYNQRGHQLYRILEVDGNTGDVRAIISEEVPTFFAYRRATAGIRDTGHNFRFDTDQERVDEININTTFTDKSYVRAILAYETHRDAGTPAAETFAIRMEQNGSFFSVAHIVEQPQKALLRRHDLDDDGTLYKALATTNGLTGSATRGMDKKFPKGNDFSDL